MKQLFVSITVFSVLTGCVSHSGDCLVALDCLSGAPTYTGGIPQAAQGDGVLFTRKERDDRVCDSSNFDSGRRHMANSARIC